MRNNNNDQVRFGSRSVILTAALILVLGTTISGTVAWMFTKADPVQNTFAYGELKIELTETDTKDDDDDRNTNTYSFTPEAVIAKDPLVTVKAGGEAVWLFVEVAESRNFSDFMEYEAAEGWTALAGYQNQSGFDANGNKIVSSVYYRLVDAAIEDQHFPVLKGNVVTVKSSVTQEKLDVMKAEEYPTLDFKAFAVQQESVATAAEAWELID